MTFKEFWFSNWNIPRSIIKAFFCERKNGSVHRTFSSKKFWAFFFVFLAGHSHIKLAFWPATHWSVDLVKAGVSDAIIITIIASLDTIAIMALGIYGICKKNGKA